MLVNHLADIHNVGVYSSASYTQQIIVLTYEIYPDTNPVHLSLFIMTRKLYLHFYIIIETAPVGNNLAHIGLAHVSILLSYL